MISSGPNLGKVLIVEDEPRLRALLSAFLASMGCEYSATISAEALATLGRETFSVVVLDAASCEISAERLILDIEDLQPNLWGRIVAITDDAAGPQTKDLIELHSLVNIPRARLFEQLWLSLQALPKSPQELRAGAEEAQIAHLVFDSFQLPSPAGVRALRQSSRHLVYQYENVKVDMLVKFLASSGQISLVGQVLGAVEPGLRNASLPVVLSGRGGPVARTTTSQYGEFNLEFGFMEDAGLRIRVGENTWIIISLGDLSWLRSRPSTAA